MRLLSLFESSTAVNRYMPIFNPILKIASNEKIINIIKTYINLGLQISSRNDWMVWWCRIARIIIMKRFSTGFYPTVSKILSLEEYKNIRSLYQNFTSGMNLDGYQDVLANGMEYIQPDFKHFMVDQNIPKIRSFRFANQSVRDVLDYFMKVEEEWKEKHSATLDMTDSYHRNEKAIVTFPDGAAWFNLGRSGCSREAEAMGHCGNGVGEEHETVLSLRFPALDDKGRRIPNVWRPALTFILNTRDGSLGEMKGRNNSKPKPEYHPYIVKLIELPLIKELRGGGYLSHNNFSLQDLDAEIRNDLLSKKPLLMKGVEAYDYITDNGIRLTKEETGLLGSKLAKEYNETALHDLMKIDPRKHNSSRGMMVLELEYDVVIMGWISPYFDRRRDVIQVLLNTGNRERFEQKAEEFKQKYLQDNALHRDSLNEFTLATDGVEHRTFLLMMRHLRNFNYVTSAFNGVPILRAYAPFEFTVKLIQDDDLSRYSLKDAMVHEGIVKQVTDDDITTKNLIDLYGFDALLVYEDFAMAADTYFGKNKKPMATQNWNDRYGISY